MFKDKKVVYVPSSERGKAYFPSRIKAEAKKNQVYYRDIPLDDNILQKKEMYQWSQKNYSTCKAWLMNVEADGKQSLCLSHYLSYIYQPSYFNMRLKKDAFTEEGRQVILSLYGFQNYLKDFTLIQEREPASTFLILNTISRASTKGMRSGASTASASSYSGGGGR